MQVLGILLGRVGVRISARSKPPPSTENPRTAARIGRSGWPRGAMVGARRGPVPRHYAPCTVPGRGAGGGCARAGPE